MPAAHDPLREQQYFSQFSSFLFRASRGIMGDNRHPFSAF